ncbi:hypothetical protein [Acaryochloris marina]|uniref:hypothetical protein n=1 Tax=Acaryochloris marina TaxID=155978 RepID=UPI0021C33FE7|nr:hypothetical protein [Acaryochloris marina]BDM82845.1 hypothetical protein AM10699_57060 [Acaryochloris marina MBIC10699]
MLADNDAAIQQRYAHWKMIEKEQDQAERAQRIKRVNSDIRKEGYLFRAAHIALGLAIGVWATLYGVSLNKPAVDPTPVVQAK